VTFGVILEQNSFRSEWRHQLLPECLDIELSAGGQCWRRGQVRYVRAISLRRRPSRRVAQTIHSVWTIDERTVHLLASRLPWTRSLLQQRPLW